MRASKNVLIVLAAGEGKRMGKPYPKMLIPLKGKPLLAWTLANLEACSAVDAVIVTVPPQWRELFGKKVKFSAFKKVVAVIGGGSERTDSTRNAMKVLPEGAAWIGIHDAARPFASCDLIFKCFSAARKTGGAILAVPSKDTVKFVRKGGLIERTIPRAQCWAAQTPQVFRRDIAEKLHGTKRAGDFTDDASIAEHLGYKVAIVPGSYENIKITTPEDLHSAELMIKRKKNA